MFKHVNLFSGVGNFVSAAYFLPGQYQSFECFPDFNIMAQNDVLILPQRHEVVRDASPDAEDSEEILSRMLGDVIKKIWQQIKLASNFAMVELGGYQLFDKIAQWSARNPIKAVCVFSGATSMLLPLLIIFGIGVGTLVMTLTGFLVLEGTLLTVVSMMLLGCLGAVVMVLLFFAVTLVAIFLGFAYIYGFFGGTERCRRIFNNFMQNENISGIASLATRQTYTQ